MIRKNPETYLDVKIDLDEIDVTPARTAATYQEIKDYILKEHGVKVSSLYIAQVKEKLGIKERGKYNKPKSKKKSSKADIPSENDVEKQAEVPTDPISIFTLKGSDGTAKGFISAGGFSVMKGSTIAADEGKSCGEGIRKKRQQLKEKGIIVGNVFTQDCRFDSPQVASSVIKGYNTNGTTLWVNESGKTIKDLQLEDNYEAQSESDGN